MVLDFFESQGWSIHIMEQVSKALKIHNMEDEQRTDYTQVAYLQPDLGPDLLAWHRRATAAVMVPAWLRNGRAKTEEEAKQLNATYQKKVDILAAAGTVFPGEKFQTICYFLTAAIDLYSQLLLPRTSHYRLILPKCRLMSFPHLSNC